MKEIGNPAIGGGGNERNHATSNDGSDKNQLVSSGEKEHYITINEIIFTKSYPSQINKAVLLSQLFNQHLYNIL